MKGPRAALLGLTLGLSGATAGYALTSNGTKSAEVDPTLDEEAQVCKIPTLSGSPEFQKANNDIERALIDAGIDPALVAEARNNPDRPIPPDWWVIILKFLNLGVGLSIDVAVLTILMQRLKTPGEKLRWGAAVPAMHWVLPELSGRFLGTALTGWPLSFAAVGCFVWLLRSMHSEGEEKELKSGFAGSWKTVAPAAASVSMDALAAGPGIVQQAAELGITPETANALQAFGGVLACTAVAIGLQKHKDKLLEMVSEDKAEIYGKALATGAFSVFLVDCLMDGLKKLFGADIPPDVQNAAVAGLSAIAPVLSYQISTRGEANAQIADAVAEEESTATGTEG